MTNLIIFGAISLIFIFIVKLAIFFTLSRMLNRKLKFFHVFKAFLIYETLEFLLIFVYLGSNGFLSIKNSVLHILLFTIVSYIIFLIAIYFTKLFNWKKGLLVFILMFFIITPLVSYLVNGSISRITKQPTLETIPWYLIVNPPLSLIVMRGISESLAGGLIIQYYNSIIIFSSSINY